MHLTPQQRLLLRTAIQLEQQYLRLRQASAVYFEIPVERWDRIRRLHHQLCLALDRRLTASARRYRCQLQPLLRCVATDLIQSADDLAALERQPNVPSLRLLYDELLSLSDEFDHVDINRKARILTVRTESIVLEEIDLGPFDIRLSLNNLGRYQPYEVWAVAANRPTSRRDISHPHVQNAVLCEGDGQQAIAKALKEGRLCEFFLLVRQVLRTYNSGSAYHPLEDWSGTPCADCGDLVNDDDRCECDRCDALLCAGCSHGCTCCSESFCAKCSRRCDGCEGRVCDHCQSRCADCEEVFCGDCLNDELCPTCHLATLENDDAEFEDASVDETPAATTSPETSAAATDVAVQPDRLGEVAVPA